MLSASLNKTFLSLPLPRNVRQRGCLTNKGDNSSGHRKGARNATLKKTDSDTRKDWLFWWNSRNMAFYIERLDQYLAVNEIAEEFFFAALLSLMAPKTYGLSPKPLLIAERFRFHKRDQIPGESVNQFMTTSRKLTEFCEFGNFLNKALRDRFAY